MWATVLGFAGGILIPLMSRIPAFSADGRMVARLERDAQVLKGLPDGRAAELMQSGIEDSVAELIEWRKDRDSRTATRLRGMLWVFVSLVLAAGASVAGLLVSRIDFDVEWLSSSVVSAIAGIVAMSVSLGATSYVRTRERRDARALSALEMQEEMTEDRQRLIDELASQAQIIYRDESLSDSERRRKLIGLGEKIDMLNRYFEDALR